MGIGSILAECFTVVGGYHGVLGVDVLKQYLDIIEYVPEIIQTHLQGPFAFTAGCEVFKQVAFVLV